MAGLSNRSSRKMEGDLLLLKDRKVIFEKEEMTVEDFLERVKIGEITPEAIKNVILQNVEEFKKASKPPRPSRKAFEAVTQKEWPFLYNFTSRELVESFGKGVRLYACLVHKGEDVCIHIDYAPYMNMTEIPLEVFDNGEEAVKTYLRTERCDRPWFQDGKR